MKSKKINNSCDKPFDQRLSTFLNAEHSLIQLSNSIPWETLELELDRHFSYGPGQPPLPIRLVIGLLIINLSSGLDFND